ncbi:MAG: hypothetical protein EXR75_00290 [Myxococcales bacterium]|nr:hypothetical protein [Myxococcales bacterium]
MISTAFVSALAHVAARALVVFAACGVAVGCGRERDTAAVPSAQNTATAPAHGWTHGGVPIATPTLLAIGAAGESTLRVTMSSGAADCAKLRATFPHHEALSGATVVDFWLVEPMLPDGRRGPYEFHSARRIDGTPDATPGRGLVARAALLDELRLEADIVEVVGLELALQDRSDPERLIAHSGDLRAQNCGRVPPRPTATAKREATLSLTIAAKRFGVEGATLRNNRGQTYLRLSRAPHRCESAMTEGYDVYLDLALAGDPPAVTLATLLGDAMPGAAAGAKGRESFVIRTVGKLADAGPISFVFDGKLEVGGFPIALAGEVAPERCVSASP